MLERFMGDLIRECGAVLEESTLQEGKGGGKKY